MFNHFYYPSFYNFAFSVYILFKTEENKSFPVQTTDLILVSDMNEGGLKASACKNVLQKI